MKNGFTLVELSIVLVIIGLLVGGILVGQSLIETVKTNRIVNDLSQYEIATKLFQSKFKKLPGDSSYFLPPGNGDNILDGIILCAPAPNAAYIRDERYQFWAHLTQAQMLKKNFVTYSPVMCGGTQNNNYEDNSVAGISYPYTQIDSKAANEIGHEKPAYWPRRTANETMSLEINVMPIQTLQIENKFGANAASNSFNSIGIVNVFGAHKCFDGDNPVSCNDPTAAYGDLRYHF